MNSKLPLAAACALAALLAAAPARAQSVHWNPAGGSLAVGETTELQLVFENCEPRTTPAPPPVAGLRLEYSSQSSSFSEVNGSSSRSVTLSYAALLTRKRSVEIPAFAVDTDQGRLTVPAVRFEPADATVGSGGQPLETAANSHLVVPPAAVWAGQVFPLGYTIDADSSYAPDFGRGSLDWNSEPLVVEDWDQPKPYTATGAGGSRTGLAYRTRALVRAPGYYRLNPVNQIVNLSVGVTGFGFFQQRQYQQFAVTSDQPTLEVRPLPAAPAGFGGAVGSFRLTSKVVPTSAAVGQPVTWTLVLSGTGNWPDIASLPARRVADDFQVIQPRPKRTQARGTAFDGTLTEDVVLIPTKPGVYPLDPVRFVYFDPRAGEYRTIATPAAAVTVTSAAAAAGPSAGAPIVSVPAPAGPVPAPESPSGLPRDALEPAGPAPAPLSGGCLGALVLAPFALLLLCWLALSFGKARRSDPGRPRREAGRRLAAALARLRHGRLPESELPAILLSWQRDAAVLWGVSHSAPTPRQLGATPAAWLDLWSEADRAIYGPAAKLPADWTKRAEAALAAERLPAFRPWRLLLPPNLLPWLFAAAVAVVGATGAVRAQESASALYWGGDFAGAESAFRARVAQSPGDWTARYDLSLALAQQDRWNEAAAYAAGALAQEPANPAVRWQFALACQKAGFAPSALVDFLTPGFAEDVAGWASPAVWQRILAAGAWLAAASLLLLLFHAYGRSPVRWRVPLGLGGLGVAAAVALAAFAGWRAYGIAADPAAAIVWRSGTLRSVPTEADTAQNTVPLPVGSMAVADKDFLGWVRLDFGNGQTGWVRKSELVWLWR